MNFLITGHTKGIGKAIYDKFGGKGLSKSTGFDISKARKDLDYNPVDFLTGVKIMDRQIKQRHEH